MIIYEYTFLDFQDVLKQTWGILEQDILSWIFIILSILIVGVAFFIIIPLCILSIKKYKKDSEIRKKKYLLTEILLKKELEDEIEKEIVMDDEKILHN